MWICMSKLLFIYMMKVVCQGIKYGFYCRYDWVIISKLLCIYKYDGGCMSKLLCLYDGDYMSIISDVSCILSN